MTKRTATATIEPGLFGAEAPPRRKAPSKKPAMKVVKKDKAAVAPSKEVAVIKPVDPRNMLAIIAEAAGNPKVDVGKMQALLSMQKEIMAEQARLDFTSAFRAMKAKLPVINKDGLIVVPPKDGKTGHKTPFATFENISKVIDPLLDEFGFTLAFETEPSADGTRLLVRGVLDHISGHQKRTTFPLPAEPGGSKNNVQAWGSSFSYGKRYATVALLNIRTSAPRDRDLDGHVAKRTKGGEPRTIEGDVVVESGDGGEGVATVLLCSEEQLIKVRDAIEGCGVSEKTFCKHFEIEKVSQLPAAAFAAALEACKNHVARRQ